MQKVIIFSLLLACLIISVWGMNCPSRWSNLSKSEGKRCWKTSNCPSGQYCCRYGWFRKRCRYPTKPAVIAKPSTGNKIAPLASSKPASETSSTSSTASHPGKCDRARRVSCSGTSCEADNQCPSNQKCCQNRCGKSTCGAALRSSSSFFSGRK